jgi:hypothetical protein
VKFILRIIKALFGRWIDVVLDGLELQAAAVYVAGVKKTRQALLMMSGFLLIHVALFIWLPWSLPLKALILLILGVVYLGGGLAVVLRLSSDRTWMKFARVDRILAGLPSRR